MKHAFTIAMTVLFFLQAPVPASAAQRSGIGDDLDRRALVQLTRGNYSQAQSLLLKALAVKEKTYGANSTPVAVSLDALGQVYQRQNKFTDAQPLFRRALEIRSSALGIDHSDTLATREHLRALYQAQGRTEDLDALEKQTSARREAAALAAAGAKSADAKSADAKAAKPKSVKKDIAPAVTQNEPAPAPIPAPAPSPVPKLASIPTAAPGDAWAAAHRSLVHAYQPPIQQSQVLVELATKALEIAARDYGPDHINTARSLNNVGYMYLRKGELNEVEAPLTRAIKIWEMAPEPNYAELAITLDNLALFNKRRGYLGMVNVLNVRSIEARIKATGSPYPDWDNPSATTVPTTTLGEEDAESFTRTISRLRGVNWIGGADLVFRVATKYANIPQYAYAQFLYQHALEVEKRSPSPRPQTIAHILKSMAALYRRQGQFDEPQRLYKLAIEILSENLGDDDPQVSIARKELTDLYVFHGRAERIRPGRGGPPEPTPPGGSATAIAIKNLFRSAESARTGRPGNVGRAEPLYLRVLEMQEESLTPDHIDIATTKSTLAAMYSTEQRYAEAAPHYVRALEIYDKRLKPTDPIVIATLIGIADLYSATGSTKQLNAIARRLTDMGRTLPRLTPPQPKLAAIPFPKKDDAPVLNLDELPLSAQEMRSVEHRLARGSKIPDMTQRMSLALILKWAGFQRNVERRFEDALTLYTIALEVAQPELEPDDPWIGKIYEDFSNTYGLMGEEEKSKEYHARAMRIFQKNEDASTAQRLHEYETWDWKDAMKFQRQLAAFNASYATGDFNEALRHALITIAFAEKSTSTLDPDVATAHANAAKAYEAIGEHDKARPHRHRVEMIRRQLGTTR